MHGSACLMNAEEYYSSSTEDCDQCGIVLMPQACRFQEQTVEGALA